MSSSDGCQINYRHRGEQEENKEKGDMKMGNSKGQRREHGENKEGWGIIAFGLAE